MHVMSRRCSGGWYARPSAALTGDTVCMVARPWRALHPSEAVCTHAAPYASCKVCVGGGVRRRGALSAFDLCTSSAWSPGCVQRIWQRLLLREVRARRTKHNATFVRDVRHAIWQGLIVREGCVRL
jgi:hypothetical protein